MITIDIHWYPLLSVDIHWPLVSIDIPLISIDIHSARPDNPFTRWFASGDDDPLCSSTGTAIWRTDSQTSRNAWKGRECWNATVAFRGCGGGVFDGPLQQYNLNIFELMWEKQCHKPPICFFYSYAHLPQPSRGFTTPNASNNGKWLVPQCLSQM